MDLRDFFVSISSGPVIAIFLTAGYPGAVARLLTGLCTNSVPLPSATGRVGERAAPPHRYLASLRPLLEPHLPGAPGSPALANLAAFGSTPARGPGAHADAPYTRYADDLVFSGGESSARTIARFPTTLPRSRSRRDFLSSTGRLASCAGSQTTRRGRCHQSEN